MFLSLKRDTMIRRGLSRTKKFYRSCLSWFIPSGHLEMVVKSLYMYLLILVKMNVVIIYNIYILVLL